MKSLLLLALLPALTTSVLGADAGMRDHPVGDVLGDYNAPFEPTRTSSDWGTATLDHQ